MIKKLVIVYGFVTLAILTLAVIYGGPSRSPASTDYGSLSVAMNFQISAEPSNSIIPAMRSVKYKTGDKLDFNPVKIHNGLDTPVTWNISYTNTVKPSYYWTAENTRATDRYGNYITCSPPPEGMQNWIIVEDPLPIKVEPKETKEIMITFDIPEGVALPDIWEFRLRYENLSQSGNVLITYDQIWQVCSGNNF